MTRALTAIVLSLLLAAPMPALARQGQGRGGGGGGRQLSFPSQGGSRHGSHGGRHYRGGYHGGGHHRHHHGSDFFFYGSFGPSWYAGWPYYRPYLYSYPYYAYPYWYAYPYSYPYPYPPVPYRVYDEDDDRDVPEESPPPADTEPASYGLVRLDGVPDGAAVELDGRFWLTADDLDERWLALPRGEHRIAVTVRDAEPIARTIRIVPGRTHVLKFDAGRT
jgi:hypothetical protein